MNAREKYNLDWQKDKLKRRQHNASLIHGLYKGRIFIRGQCRENPRITELKKLIRKT